MSYVVDHQPKTAHGLIESPSIQESKLFTQRSASFNSLKNFQFHIKSAFKLRRASQQFSSK